MEETLRNDENNRKERETEVFNKITTFIFKKKSSREEKNTCTQYLIKQESHILSFPKIYHFLLFFIQPSSSHYQTRKNLNPNIKGKRKERERDRETDRQTDRQRERQTDRQIESIKKLLYIIT